MIKKLTYKNKNILLLAGILIFSIIMYQLSIRETLNQREAYKETLIQYKKSENAPKLINKLKTELQQIDQLIGTNESFNIDVQQLILEKVTNYCKKNRLLLKKFPQPIIESEPNYQIETTKLTVQGSFIPLLKLVYAFEQEYNLGKVVSVEFKTEKELRTRKNRLFATLFIQNIKKN